MKDAFRELLDKRFGMFVHYGIYSAFAGYRQGKPTEGLGEWIMMNEHIPIAEYEAYGKEHFNPNPDFAKNLVAAAKKAGVKFIVITSKHHDGFCLFKSEASDYTTHAWFGRDIIKEVSDECKKEGIGLGLYYSHTLDWHEKDAAGNVCVYDYINTEKVHRRNFWDYPDDNIDLEKYLREKCFPQVKELLTNYGDIELIWFDYPHDITKEQTKELRDLVKSLQPDCQINSRIAHGMEDYISLSDNSLPVAPVGVNMECLITLNHSWGYKKQDNNWKTPFEAADILCRTLTSDSTLLLNVGPKADGSLTPETHEILEKMGEWTKVNGEAIYGRVYGNPLSTTFPWGFISTKENAVYLYVTDKTKKELVLPGVVTKATKVSIIGGDEAEFSQTETILKIKTKEFDSLIPVYKIEFSSEPEFSKAIVQCDDVTTLGVLWASKKDKDGKIDKLIYEKDPYGDLYGKRGLILDTEVFTNFWTSKDEALCWNVYFNDPGEYEAEIVHATRGPVCYNPDYVIEDEYTLSVGDKTEKVDMKNSGQAKSLNTAGEQNGVIPHFAGRFLVSEAGEKRVMLNKAADGINIPFTEIRFIKVK